MELLFIFKKLLDEYSETYHLYSKIPNSNKFSTSYYLRKLNWLGI